MLVRTSFLLWYALAAVSEIGGCFAFWLWLREGRSAWWTVPGVLALMVFAVALTRIPASQAGRAFAAYGGIYIAFSVLWLWMVERVVPSRTDLIGSAVALSGAVIIYLGRLGA